MATADLLLELMFSWIKQRELCAEQLRKLAQELESLRETCDFSEFSSSSFSVLGAACVVGASVATVFSAGAAAPFFAFLGAAYTGVGVTWSAVTKLTEHFLSSSTMKEAQKIEEESNKIAERIQELSQQLKAEVKNRSPSADADEVDQHIMTEIVKAVGRRSGLKGGINMLQFFLGAGPRSTGLSQSSHKEYAVMVKIASILKFFSFEINGNTCRRLLTKGARQIIRLTSNIAVRKAVKGGAKIVGGIVGLGFALHEAKHVWKKMMANNHVTEASKSMRDTAEDLLNINQTLRDQFDDIRNMLDQMATSQQEEEEKLKQNCKDPETLNKDDVMSSSPAQEKRSQQTETETGQRHEDKQRAGQTEQSRDKQEGGSQETEVTGSGQLGVGGQGDENSDDEDDRKKKITEIRMALLNVRSLKKKTKEILKLIRENNLHVFNMTETWLRMHGGDAVLIAASPNNFSFIQQTRDPQGTGRRRGGGVSIQFSLQFQSQRINLSFSITTFEYVAILLGYAGGPEVLIINVYRPPRSSLGTFLRELQDLLDVFQSYNNVIMTGDFNIRVDQRNTRTTLDFENFLARNDLVQHVMEPTHQVRRRTGRGRPRRGHILDLVITRNVEITILSVRVIGISDHFGVFFSARPVSRNTGKDTDQDELANRKTEE